MHPPMLLWFGMLITQFTRTASQYNYRNSCLNTSTYTPNSTYEANVKYLLSALSSNGNHENGFYNFTAGDRDRVYGMFMCRGDVSTGNCGTCVNQASSDILRVCPNQKTAVIWYDLCMLRFSDKNIFQRLDQSVYVNMSATEKNSQPSFMKLVVKTLEEMTRRVAGNSMKCFAYKSNFTEISATIYSLGQCTPDISDSDCYTCLKNATQILPTCCNSALGARVLFPSCNIRYELYGFYSNTTAVAPPPIRPPPPNTMPPSPGKTFLLHLYL